LAAAETNTFFFQKSVIDAGVVPALVSLLATGDFDVKREACWAISNATTGGSHSQVSTFVNHGCIKPLCDVLVSSDVKIVSVALEALENILKSGQVLASKTKDEDNKYL
jgi:importin subunit alpha-1